MVKRNTKHYERRCCFKNDNNSKVAIICAICTCLTILFASFLFPYVQYKNQSKENILKDKQRTAEVFMTCITQTVSYAKLYRQYQCDLLKEKDIDVWKIKTQMTFEYWEKLVSLNPTYEAACSSLSIYFDSPIYLKSDVLKIKIDRLLDLDISSIEQKKDDEKKLIDEIDSIYIQITKLLSEDIRKYKMRSYICDLLILF
jgi:hypothetical protein